MRVRHSAGERLQYSRRCITSGSGHLLLRSKPWPLTVSRLPLLGSRAVGVGPSHVSIGRAAPLIADQCPRPLGCELTKLFGSRPSRRNFTIALARCVSTSATRFRQAAVSASKAIWSSVILSNSASEYGVLRSLLGSSQAGSELFDGSSFMSCPGPMPQVPIVCWRRLVHLSNSLNGYGFSQGCDHVVNDQSVRSDTDRRAVDETGQYRHKSSKDDQLKRVIQATLTPRGRLKIPAALLVLWPFLRRTASCQLTSTARRRDRLAERRGPACLARLCVARRIVDQLWSCITPSGL